MPLERFHEAQADSFATALAELRAGRKRSHWIWFVFPQIRALGRSSTAQFYGIESNEEGREYLRDATLLSRYLAVAEAVLAQAERGIQLTQLMGGETDALKLTSSLTYFRALAAAFPPPTSAEIKRIIQVATEILDHGAAQGYALCARSAAAAAG